MKQTGLTRIFLKKILYNLLGNAIKYTPENGFITLGGRRLDNKYEISVSNSGNYIPRPQQQKIFERFYQSNSKNPGTGIGLALTKDLVEIHKGNNFAEKVKKAELRSLR